MVVAVGALIFEDQPSMLVQTVSALSKWKSDGKYIYRYTHCDFLVCERGGVIKREGHRHVSKRDEARVEEIVIQGLHATRMY